MRLSFTKHAQKDLAALNASQRDRIIQALDQILINPEHAELRKIKMKPGQWPACGWGIGVLSWKLTSSGKLSTSFTSNTAGKLTADLSR